MKEQAPIMTEITPIKPDLTIPTFPASRLKDENASLRSYSKIPLVIFLATVFTPFLSFFNRDWVPLINLLTLCLAGIAILSSGVLIYFVIRARKTQKAKIQSAVNEILPLVKEKYGADLTPDLLVSLISGAKLPIYINKEVRRVQIINRDYQTVLIEAEK